MRFALTWHIEGPQLRPSGEIYAEVADQVVLADELGFDYAWFAEHHAHVHLGHLPCPLLFAIHLAGKTRRIRLGSAVICLNMHDAVDVAEQVAVADILTGGRIAPGFGSGSTPEELTFYNRPDVDHDTRHARFESSLQSIRAIWSARPGRDDAAAAQRAMPLPLARPDLGSRTWIAANSPEAAAIAGRGGHNVMFSYLRTVEEYRTFRAAYERAGGSGSVAVNRAVYVGADDTAAWADVQPALRTLWRRFVQEGKLPADGAEPHVFTPDNVPAQFVVGSAATVRRAIASMQKRVAFDTFNIEPRWAGLHPEQVHASLRRFARELMPELRK